MKYIYRIIQRIINMMNEHLYGKIDWHIEADDYYEFTMRKEAERWGNDHYKQWAEQYARTMKLFEKVIKPSSNLCSSPIECYCGYSYRHINQYMRYERDTENGLYRELSNVLSLTLCTAPRIPCNLVVYRMVNNDFINMLIENNKKESPAPTLEKGFMSTSLLKDIVNQNEPYAAESNMLKIFVPKGTIGVYVNSITSRTEEEMLLFPNMYLAMTSYPYIDATTGKMIFECKLVKYYS